MNKIIRVIFLFLMIISLFCSCASKQKLVLEEEKFNESGIDYSKTWVKKESKNVDEVFGTIRLRAKKNIGSFNISVVDDMGKTIPCFATSNEYITTSFYLKAGNKIIKLNEDSCVDSAVRKIQDGMQILYSIEKVADVFITFQCVESVPGSKLTDTVKVTAHIVNTGKKKTEFQLKGIFDTVLGETDRHHFYDSNNQPVKNEKLMTKLTENDWFVSKNTNASIQFIFCGAKDTTQTSIVAMANYSTLDTKYWEPDMLTYRAFDTVLSYNNSAVGAIWKAKKIGPDESSNDVFYLCTSYGNAFPNGEALLEKSFLDNQKNNEVLQKKNTSQNNNDFSDVRIPTEITDEGAENKDFSNSNNNDSQYTKEYIQSIIDRIQELSDSGEDVDSYEIRRLNEELDEILKTYRK